MIFRKKNNNDIQFFTLMTSNVNERQHCVRFKNSKYATDSFGG